MKPITFIDTEVEPKSGKILDIGAIKGDNLAFHSTSRFDFAAFLKSSEYICGHNIFKHDLQYIRPMITSAGIDEAGIIDTLYLSPLMFPMKPYHALLKDDKLQTDELNNPLNDAIKARDLFFDEVTAFNQTDDLLKQIYYGLLGNAEEFRSFFEFVGFMPTETDIGDLIHQQFHGRICEEADLERLITEHTMELSYCLALINTNSRYSITPRWVTKNYPDIEKVMYLLRSKPCIKGCTYCKLALDVYGGLKRFFGYDSYRTFDGEPLQEKAVQAAIDNRSLLSIFPTGGGKSITFQVPALMSGENTKGLTVVISPLQSLMKDQVDNLEKMGITEAVTINGLLDPIERAKSFERVEEGSASILYISPESLRSKTIERLLLGRNVVRFVIDEAHCFSSWGQDFRVDYLYIGDFIKSLQEQKNLADGIPVSCFTATAKPQVIEDIRQYFREKLRLDLELFSTSASRHNLRYRVFHKDTEEEKYNTVRDLIQEKNCPTIIYVSRTRKAEDLAERLTANGFPARPYHGRMDNSKKSENQDLFISGQVQIMVATSAFGMGVDKKDVGMVIHFEISDSLENYVQEAGRAGRDESISAECFVLFNNNDLSNHFVLLNQTKLSIQEIQQIWKAIKDITRFRATASRSARELARRAGWDENVKEIETRVKTAVLALEQSGYIRRGQNMPRVYADSIQVKNAKDAINRINASDKCDEKQKLSATRIITYLISRRRDKRNDSTRIDEIADHLGLEKTEVIDVVNFLRLEKILGDRKDLMVFIKKHDNGNRSRSILKSFDRIERFLVSDMSASGDEVFNIKKLNEDAQENGCNDTTTSKIKTILNLWAIKQWIKKQHVSNNHIAAKFIYDQAELGEFVARRNDLAEHIVEYFFQLSSGEETSSGEVLVEFSLLELKEHIDNNLRLFNREVRLKEIEDALFYLSRIEALTIEGGFLVVYNALTIERLEKNNRKNYKNEDYSKLNQYYQNKTQQIHIVGEYARKMLESYRAALEFVDDYFRLNYNSFLTKYFKGNRKDEINRPITSQKFREVFGQLSPLQLEIINDSRSKYIVVAAGPGSGKTRILVHKLASLLFMEDVKHEQLLMVTFSRSAATEFKKRLIKLISSAAHFVEIKTFHSYCFDLLGRVGTVENSADIIQEAVKRIKNGEVEPSRITKTVLVIDEAQDMDANEYALVEALLEQNEDMRLIAVGDDDQNIYEFRGASSKYLKMMLEDKGAAKYELVENYRSKSNLVDYTNQYVKRIPYRLKETPIIPQQKDNGTIRLIRYGRNTNLITPLVDDILSAELAGSTCVLTSTNEEALQITGLLVKNGMTARLIQTNDGFNLYNLLEIRFFLNRLQLEDGSYTISDDMWLRAKWDLKRKYGDSANFDITTNVVKDFEYTNPSTKYKSDLELFIRESKLEDFFGFNREAIFVSTIHKAKGREFDNVFIMLDRFNISSDERKRLLYVGMTRAIRNLTIHCNGNYLDNIKTEGLNIAYDSMQYMHPPHLAMQLTYKDVWLDFFMPRQNMIYGLKSGDVLSFDGECCRTAKGVPVLMVSKQAAKQIGSWINKGYRPKDARVRFIVHWQKEDSEDEVKIVLPEVHFEKARDVSSSRKYRE